MYVTDRNKLVLPKINCMNNENMYLTKAILVFVKSFVSIASEKT